MGRTPCCSKLGLNKGPWTPEEDILLIKYINTHGEGGWTKLPKKAGLLRCGKSCRLRWMNYLRPDVKRGYILPEEEDLILRLHRLLGNRWSLIAGRIPGRTDNEIKNYWNTHLSKQLISQGIDPRTHKPLAPESMQPPPKKPCYDREQQNRHPPPPPEFPITVVDQNPADFTCLGALQYPMMNIVQAPTYVFHDQMTTVPLLHQTLFDNTGLSSNLSTPNYMYGFDGFDQQMNLNPNHSSVENYSGLDYQNYYVQEAQSDHTKLLECSENYELVSGIDQEVGCSFFGGLNSSEQLLLQSVPHGNECTIAGWPSFSAEIALLNYGQEMNSTSFQSQQQ